jgi:Cu2+-exporting ATPase
VAPGMLLEVRAGDTLAADGTVEQGTSTLDLALLTGESRPESVAPGDAVFGGTVNLSSTLRVRVTGAGTASRLGRLLSDVEQGARERAPVVLLADRMAAAFIAVVLVLAALTLVLWWPRDRHAAMDHAIALLVVTCPCALAMATPLSITVAIGRAARRGILIKGGHALESLTTPGTLFLDKTGTLTEGRLSLASWDGHDAVRALVLAVERGSRHPVAAAFEAAWAGSITDVPRRVRWRRETIGGGVEAVVRDHHVIVGRPDWVRAQLKAPDDGDRIAKDVAMASGVAMTTVLVAVDGEVVGRARFGDPLRAAARPAVAALRARGWDVRILSGDAPEVVARVAAELGIPAGAAEGNAAPERKREAVREAARTVAGRTRRPVVMVGDGVNDAPAIALATVGIAVRGGAEASMAAADVYLARGGIAALEELLDGAQRTSGIIRRNMVIALGYNAVGVALAMLGAIDPLFAAILMPVSSLTVVLGAWQARTFPRASA